MEAVSGSFATHDHEYEYVEWLPAAEAIRRIAYPNEARLIQQAVTGVEPDFSDLYSCPEGEKGSWLGLRHQSQQRDHPRWP